MENIEKLKTFKILEYIYNRRGPLELLKYLISIEKPKMENVFDYVKSFKDKESYNKQKDLYVSLPRNKFLIVDTICSYNEGEIISKKIVVKLNKTAKKFGNKYTYLHVYASENDENDYFYPNRIRYYEKVLAHDSIIYYKELELTDGPLLINWYWIAQSLKKELFFTQKNIH